MLTRFFCFVSLFFGVGFASPLLIMLANRDDIPFSLPTFSLVSLAVVLAAGGALHFLSSKATTSEKPARIALTIALALAVQGNIVHDWFYYGEFDGQALDWRVFGWKFWAEWFGFLLAFPLFYWGLSRLRQVPIWLALAPVASSLLLVTPAVLVAAGQSSQSRSIEFDHEVFHFSSELNLLHLLPDGFQGDIVREVLESHPDLARRLRGFTFYRNHLGMYGRTAPSVPLVLTGRPFDFARGFDYQQLNNDIAAHAYSGRLQENGFRVDYVSYAAPYCPPGADTCVTRPFGGDFKSRGYFSGGETRFGMGLLIDLTLFRHAPMFLKEAIYDHGHWWMSDIQTDGSPSYPDPVVREWIANIDVVDGPPRYKWYHYIGTHYPPQWNAECEFVRDLEWTRENFSSQARCVLDGIAALADALREQGIFDRTAIIISGDHGVFIAPDDATGQPANAGLELALTGLARPALLIKALGDDAPLRFSDVPTSLLDVAPTALDLVGLSGDFPGQTVLDIAAYQPRTRLFHHSARSGLVQGRATSFDTYEVSGPVNDVANWSLTNLVRTDSAPSRYGPMRFGTASPFSLGLAPAQRADFAWIGGTHLAALVSVNSPGQPARLVFSMGLPPSLSDAEQTFTVSVNRIPLGGTHLLGHEPWVEFDLAVPADVLEKGNNLVSMTFAEAALLPGTTQRAAARIRSLHLGGQDGKPSGDQESTATAPETALTLSEATQIVEAYGEVLSRLDAGIRPNRLSLLPYPKNRIKAALFAILDSADDPNQEKLLGTAVRLLSTFQEGVQDTVEPDAMGPGGQTWQQVIEAEMSALTIEMAERKRSAAR